MRNEGGSGKPGMSGIVGVGVGGTDSVHRNKNKVNSINKPNQIYRFKKIT